MADGLLQVVFAPPGDRFGKRQTMSLAAALAALCNLLVSQSPSLATLGAARMAGGAAAAGVVPLAIALVGDAVTARTTSARILPPVARDLGGNCLRTVP